MEITQIIQIAKLLAYAGGTGLVFYAWHKYNQVKKSIGWSMVTSLGNVKIGLGGKDLALRVKSPSGKEYYDCVRHSPIIDYDFKEKGKTVKKHTIYDERAVDYMNGIPVLTVTPLDIRPIDRETGLLVNIPSEIIDKLAVDSSKTAENEQMNNKTIKIMAYTIGAIAILFFVGLSYINQTNTEVQAELMKCTLELAKTATIIGS